MKNLVVSLFVICLTAGVANATMLKGPYMIYPGVNTEMMVLWQLDSTQTCTLEWGTSTSYGSSVQTTEIGDHQHEKVITGLTPSQKYYYRVNDGSYHTGSFYAAPSTSATSVKFLAFGDCRTNTATFDLVASKIVTTFQADSAYQTFTMLSGDWVNSGKTDYDWQNEFFNRSFSNILQMQANLPINGAVGNHETLTSGGNDGNMFVKYFPYPYVNSGWDSSWTTGTHFWSFDYGPVHVAVVDQYDGGYGVISQGQLDWLESDLAATDRTFKVIQLHEPGWSGDGQGGHTDNTQVQEAIQPLCLAYGVEMVIGGHNHYYVRCEVQEVMHITTGGAGPTLDTPDPDYTPYVVVVSQSYNFMKLDADASAEEIDVVVEDTSGDVIDSFTIDHVYSVMLPWSDGFESGDFAGGGWIVSDRYCVVGTDSYAGTYAAVIEKPNWIVKSISTTGMSDIHVKYARKTLDIDAGEYLYVEWSVDGTNWNQLEATQDTSWTFVDKTCSSGADDNRAFAVRFRLNAGVKEKGFVDSVEVTGITAAPDTDPPTPDPMTWVTVPYATNDSSIAMVATTATDASGVMYYFTCTAGGGSDSGWQSGTSYEDAGLSPNTQYTYTVTARDISGAQNTTAASSAESATAKFPGDVDIDGDVDFDDFAYLAAQWQQSPGTVSADIAPVPGDGFVDMLDLAVLINDWLSGK
ncbi:MAG: metallophosphoesterase family protein [Planctomycetes bacterium]|nr:metallophosphoesterase family protein [Planctomycetota bacterium]